MIQSFLKRAANDEPVYLPDIRKAFQEEIPDTTKIIIAQRISSVQDSDQIIVMESGRIVEKGNHEELLALKGIYSEIYESQTKGKEEN